MRRDMDLVRSILLILEAKTENSVGPYTDFAVDGHSDESVSYHVGLMKQAGLIEACDAGSCDGESWLPRALTWQGHDFLETSRDPSLWTRAKEIVRQQTGGLTIEALRQVLSELVRHAVTVGLGAASA